VVLRLAELPSPGAAGIADGTDSFFDACWLVAIQTSKSDAHSMASHRRWSNRHSGHMVVLVFTLRWPKSLSRCGCLVWSPANRRRCFEYSGRGPFFSPWRSATAMGDRTPGIRAARIRELVAIPITAHVSPVVC